MFFIWSCSHGYFPMNLISHRSTSSENKRERRAPNLDVQGFRDSVNLEDKDCECTLPNSLRSKSTDFSPTSDGIIFQFHHIFFDAFILLWSLETPPELTNHSKTFFFKSLKIYMTGSHIKSNQTLSENSIPSRAVSKYYLERRERRSRLLHSISAGFKSCEEKTPAPLTNSILQPRAERTLFVSKNFISNSIN